MSTITFEMPTEQAEALSRAADRRGVRVEDLLRHKIEIQHLVYSARLFDPQRDRRR